MSTLINSINLRVAKSSNLKTAYFLGLQRFMNTLKKTLIFFCCFGVFIGYSQTKQQQIDSLKWLLKSTHNDSIFLNYQLQLGKLLYDHNTKEAELYFKQVLKSLDSTYLFPNKLQIKSVSYDYLGNIERRKNNYDKALEYYLKSLTLKEQTKDSLKIGKSYHDIAKLFSAKREYDKAIFYIKKSLKLRKNNPFSYGETLRNYGKFLYLKKDYPAALKILDSATFFLNKSPLHMADVNTVYAKIYRTQGKLYESLKILNRNLDIYNTFEKREKKANIYIDIAVVYKKLNESKKALKYLDSAETIHNEFKNKKVISNIFFERYQIFNAKKDHKKALENYLVFKKYSDSVFTTQQISRVAQLEIDYKNDKKEAINRLIVEANKKQLKEVAKTERLKKQLYAILFILSLLGLIILFIIYRNKQRIQLEKMEKKGLETALLNEKTVFMQYKIDQLLANNKMRTDFKEELVSKVKKLKTQANSNQLMSKYQSILIQLENQIKTEERVTTLTSKKATVNADGFELKLAKAYPELTKAEREICNLIYLNLSSKEIVNVRNVSISSVKSARYRIRKKLAIPKNIEIELFIKHLFNDDIKIV